MQRKSNDDFETKNPYGEDQYTNSDAVATPPKRKTRKSEQISPASPQSPSLQSLYQIVKQEQQEREQKKREQEKQKQEQEKQKQEQQKYEASKERLAPVEELWTDVLEDLESYREKEKEFTAQHDTEYSKIDEFMVNEDFNLNEYILIQSKLSFYMQVLNQFKPQASHAANDLFTEIETLRNEIRSYAPQYSADVRRKLMKAQIAKKGFEKKKEEKAPKRHIEEEPGFKAAGTRAAEKIEQKFGNFVKGVSGLVKKPKVVREKKEKRKHFENSIRAYAAKVEKLAEVLHTQTSETGNQGGLDLLERAKKVYKQVERHTKDYIQWGSIYNSHQHPRKENKHGSFLRSNSADKIGTYQSQPPRLDVHRRSVSSKDVSTLKKEAEKKDRPSVIGMFSSNSTGSIPKMARDLDNNNVAPQSPATVTPERTSSFLPSKLRNTKRESGLFKREEGNPIPTGVVPRGSHSSQESDDTSRSEIDIRGSHEKRDSQGESSRPTTPTQGRR